MVRKMLLSAVLALATFVTGSAFAETVIFTNIQSAGISEGKDGRPIVSIKGLSERKVPISLSLENSPIANVCLRQAEDLFVSGRPLALSVTLEDVTIFDNRPRALDCHLQPAPVICPPPPPCVVPPPGCYYEPVKDPNGCTLGCGRLVCKPY